MYLVIVFNVEMCYIPTYVDGNIIGGFVVIDSYRIYQAFVKIFIVGVVLDDDVNKSEGILFRRKGINLSLVVIDCRVIIWGFRAAVRRVAFQNDLEPGMV